MPSIPNCRIPGNIEGIAGIERGLVRNHKHRAFWCCLDFPDSEFHLCSRFSSQFSPLDVPRSFVFYWKLSGECSLGFLGSLVSDECWKGQGFVCGEKEKEILLKY